MSADQPNTDSGGQTEPEPFQADSWGQAARGICLFVLLGMSLVVFLQLSFGADWVYGFLRKNQLPMPQRMRLIYEMLGVGGALGVAGLLPIVLSDRAALRARVLEQWAWFLSPLMLLPLIPVALEHRVWFGRHEQLLPVVLFGGIIAEFLVSKSLESTPEAAANLFRRLFSRESEPSASDKEGENSRNKAQLDRVLSFVEKHAVLITVILAALAYGAFMSFYTIRWHNKLGTATFDLGINNNLMFGGLHGKFNQSPVIFPDEPQKYLANHVKIGLYGFLPIYALYPKAETLLAIQSVSLGLGAIPLFLFARKRIPAWWAAALCFCYLAYYPMHGANFYEMKVVPTAAAVVLLCIWAIDDKRWILGGIAFAWAMIMREDMPVPLVVVGGVFLLSGHRPIAGALMAGIAAVWFILLRFRFMNEVGSWWFPKMYEDLWADPEKGFQSVIKTLLSNPTYTLKHIFTEKKFWYLMHLMVPLMYLPVRRWYGWAALVPGAILTLLVTDYKPPILFSFQYVMHWAPYLFIAASLVLAAMSRTPKGRSRALGALFATCVTSAALSYNYGAFSRRDKALESGYHKIEFSFSPQEAEMLKHVRALVASLPPNATVGSTERIGAHLSSRVGFYTLRRGSHGVEYMVARKKGLRLDRTKSTIFDGLESGEYGVQARFGDFIVFRRGADTSRNEQVIEEWQLKSRRSKRSLSKRDLTARTRSSASNTDDDRDRDIDSEAKSASDDDDDDDDHNEDRDDDDDQGEQDVNGSPE